MVATMGCTYRCIKITTVLLILLVALVIMTTYNAVSIQLKVSNSTSLHESTQTLKCPVLSLSKSALPKTALASFPGSGNTWTRHLIQQMTGIQTGAIYRDKQLMENGFPGEGKQDGQVIVIKTHENFSSEYKKCVLLMRNPYEALIAEFNRLYSDLNHTAYANLRHFVKAWNPFFGQYARSFKSLYYSWLQHKNMHLVLYNNLKHNLPRELHKLLVFLQQSTNVTGEVQCALNNREGDAKRDHSKSLPYEFFYSQGQIKTLNQIISDLATAYSSRYPREVLLMRKWKM